MAISFPRTTRSKLTQAIADGLRDSEVISGSYVALDTKCWHLHEAIPEGSKPEQALRSIAGDRHVTEFVRSEISRHFPSEWDTDAKTLSLGLILGTDGIVSLSEKLVQSMETLPWSYKFFSELAGEFDVQALGATEELRVTPMLRLVAGKRLATELPSENSLANLRDAPKRVPHVGWPLNSIQVELELNGFVSKDLESDTVQDAIDQLFSFYGLAIALDLLEPGNAWINLRPASSYAMKIFQTTEISTSYVSQAEFDPSHAKAIHDLGTPRSWRGTTNIEAFRLGLRSISQALLNVDQRVLNAARWYFDSHCGANLQVRFVQIATAFEILLGDHAQSRETGLSTLMANRCAYMLGKNEASRRKICEAFRAGYDIRSKIVHTGKTRLSSNEIGHFSYMQALCALVIRRECSEFLSRPE